MFFIENKQSLQKSNRIRYKCVQHKLIYNFLKLYQKITQAKRNMLVFLPHSKYTRDVIEEINVSKIQLDPKNKELKKQLFSFCFSMLFQ